MTSQGVEVPSGASIPASVTMEEGDNCASASSLINETMETSSSSSPSNATTKQRKRADNKDTPYGGDKKSKQKASNHPNQTKQTALRRRKRQSKNKSTQSTSSSDNNTTTTPHPSATSAAANSNSDCPETTAIKPRQLLPTLEKGINNNEGNNNATANLSNANTGKTSSSSSTNQSSADQSSMQIDNMSTARNRSNVTGEHTSNNVNTATWGRGSVVSGTGGEGDINNGNVVSSLLQEQSNGSTVEDQISSTNNNNMSNKNTSNSITSNTNTSNTSSNNNASNRHNNTLSNNASSNNASSNNASSSNASSNNNGSKSKKKKTTCKMPSSEILEKGRPNTFGKAVSSETYFDEDEMDAYQAAFVKETQVLFKTRSLHGQVVLKQPVGSANNSKSSLPIGLSRLNRYHWEDMATQYSNEGEDPLRFRVFIAAQNNETRWKQKQYIFDHQRRKQLGVEKRIFGGKLYFGLYATLVPNEQFKSIKAGEMSKDDIIAMHSDYNLKFALQFDGVTVRNSGAIMTMQFTTGDMVDDAKDLMFFGTATESIRAYDRIFKDRTSLPYVHQIYRDIADEVRGDPTLAHALNSAYFQKLSVLNQESLKMQQEGQLDAVCKDATFLGKDKTTFFKEVDKAYEKNLKESMTTFQDYTQPIIIMLTLMKFIEQSKLLFPAIWQLFGSLRNIKSNAKRGKALVASKELQIFFTILAMARMADPQRLKHWAAVSSFAMFGWGVKNKAQDFQSHFGHVCSTDARNLLMKEMTTNLLAAHILLLSSCTALILVYDNFQRGQHLTEQREGKSSNYLKGTHQLANTVNEYTDTTHDESRVEMKYVNQPFPSPPGLPAFETVTLDSPVEVKQQFVSKLVPNAEPDFTGVRCDAYFDLLATANIINHIWRCFATENVCPESKKFDSSKIDKVHKIVRSDAAEALFVGTKSFQENVTECWNSTVGDVTQTIMLGLLGIAEESSNECGAISLDQLYRMGILLECEDGTWELAPNWESRRPYLFGDAKTVENVSKFVRELASRQMSYDTIHHQADIFMDAMSIVMQLPGDWHAGLAMLQAIYTLFYRAFLEPFQKALGWKRINIDVSGCYFQASRLAGFVADELMRALVYEFASSFDEFDATDPNADCMEFVCKFALEFIKFLQEMKKSDDQWRKACALFLLMYLDFRTFVDSYRTGDSIMILGGYRKFAPVWQKLGQTKYVERTWHQFDQLFRDFKFSRFVESMRNRCVRRYPKDSGKRMMAQDEALELKNKSFAEFPLVKKLTSFMRQGDFIGVVERCKRFVEMFYVITKEEKDREIHQASTKPSMIPEKKRVFELFMLLDTTTYHEGRRFVNSLVWKMKDKLKTIVTRKDKEASKKDSSGHSYNRIFSSISQIFPPANRANSDDDGDEDMIDATNVSGEEDTAESAAPVSLDDIDEDEEMAPWRETHEWEAEVEEAGNVDEKGYHKLHTLMLNDLWEEGNKHFTTQNLSEVRAASVQRAIRLRRVNAEISRVVKEQQEEAKYMNLGEERDGQPIQPWRKYLGEMRKKTGLTNVLSI